MYCSIHKSLCSTMAHNRNCQRLHESKLVFESLAFETHVLGRVIALSLIAMRGPHFYRRNRFIFRNSRQNTETKAVLLLCKSNERDSVPRFSCSTYINRYFYYRMLWRNYRYNLCSWRINGLAWMNFDFENEREKGRRERDWLEIFLLKNPFGEINKFGKRFIIQLFFLLGTRVLS